MIREILLDHEPPTLTSSSKIVRNIMNYYDHNNSDYLKDPPPKKTINKLNKNNYIVPMMSDKSLSKAEFSKHVDDSFHRSLVGYGDRRHV